MDFKKCGNCGETKSIDDFYRQARAHDGHSSQCKICSKARAKQWTIENRGRSNAIKAAWKQANPEKARIQARKDYVKNSAVILARKKVYRAENPETEKASNKLWRIDNHQKILAANRARREAKKRATPSWLTREHRKRMALTYKLASVLSNATRVKHHVDHIVPIQGENVCGLHVPWNLKAKPASENISKKNRFEEGDRVF